MYSMYLCFIPGKYHFTMIDLGISYSRVSELLARFENYVYFAMNLALLNWS